MVNRGYISQIRKHPTYYTGKIRRTDGKGNEVPFITNDSFKIFDIVEYDLEDRSKKARTIRFPVNAINLKLIQRGRRDV